MKYSNHVLLIVAKNHNSCCMHVNLIKILNISNSF